MATLTPKPFAHKTIAITGAAQGIGLAIAHYLASRGANLALSDIKRSELEAAHQSLSQAFPDIIITSTVVDVSSTPSINAWIASTLSTFGAFSGAVNNAGILGPWVNITDIKDEDWERVQRVNVGGVMRCLRAELGVIEEGGSIVNLSSVAGLKGCPGLSPYVTSKHAIIGLTKCAAMEAGRRGVRVNAVCPGSIETPMLVEVEAGLKLPPGPLGRGGTPEEVASMVGYLLGPESVYMSGCAIPIDGGLCSA
ncbi:3-oxoacyl-reductase [Lepidopterella palustris CBS 459.81]|uniref:3-oxoacyl-reductase n=1 Tax=Lepidopterella palustris CBS 459.81 TaxID=1314670 RepID=A0A8E2E671_9PEZI|nr:3-oxoacyl-reductase [Lepidopterella palustris CBS 459.81]